MKSLPPNEEILLQLDYCPKTGEFKRQKGKKITGYVHAQWVSYDWARRQKIFCAQTCVEASLQPSTPNSVTI